MKFNQEAEYLMLSGIQHFQFCRRQWALIHIEQQWVENVKTIEGQIIHQKVDQPELREKRKNHLIVRAMPIQSHTLKTTGICDVVEFIEDEHGVFLPKEQKKYRIIPVEYKRGKVKKGKEDLVQLVAQAICLEEMFLIDVPTGVFFYNETKQRVQVEITEDMKNEVRDLFKEMYGYYQKQYTPKVKMGKHCKSCSLESICLPNTMAQESVKKYMEKYL
ncbi:CRISPR-associated protein Cas4 [Kurthia gibsonii]|uniref:CRISPR-associated protein Cas4 n=1 Tax=Kurthia gibsonii TaxID=33946 RepID=UPI0031B6F49F